MRHITITRSVIFWIMLFILTPFILNAAEPPAVDPKADRLLKQMSDYLAAREQFVIQAEATHEKLLDSGQKLMFVNQVTVSVKRPSRFYVHRKGMIRDQEIFYDGKKLTLFGRTAKFFATAPAPSTIDEALDYATETLGLSAPGGDLFYSDIYKGLVDDIISGEYVGLTDIGGVPCHHLAFRGAEVDWQLWIEDGDKPLPRRYVITSKWLTAAPQYTLTIRSWDTTMKIPEKRFQFTVPEGVSQIDFLSEDQGTSAKNN